MAQMLSINISIESFDLTKLDKVVKSIKEAVVSYPDARININIADMPLFGVPPQSPIKG